MLRPDVLDDDDVASCDVVVESQQALHVPCRTGPFVGGELDERNLAGEVDLLDQIAQKHERTVEHPDEDRTLLVAVIGVETLGDGCDGAVDLVGGDHHLEGFIVQRYGFLHIVFAVFGSVSVSVSMKIPSKGSAFCGIIPNLARETFVGEAGVRRPYGQRSIFRPRV